MGSGREGQSLGLCLLMLCGLSGHIQRKRKLYRVQEYQPTLFGSVFLENSLLCLFLRVYSDIGSHNNMNLKGNFLCIEYF